MTGSAGLLGSNSTLTLLIRPDLSQAGTSYGPHFKDRTALDNAPSLVLEVTAVPEPGSWAMLTLGLLAVGAGARRRKAVGNQQ